MTVPTVERGILPGGLLLDRDGGREPLDGVDVGLFHQPEELPGVGRERLDVAPLPLGVDGVEGERGFPRAGEPGDDRQPVAGNGDGDVLEVVLAGAPHHQIFLSHSPESYPKPAARVNGFRESATSLSIVSGSYAIDRPSTRTATGDWRLVALP